MWSDIFSVGLIYCRLVFGCFVLFSAFLFVLVISRVRWKIHDAHGGLWKGICLSGAKLSFVVQHISLMPKLTNALVSGKLASPAIFSITQNSFSRGQKSCNNFSLSRLSSIYIPLSASTKSGGKFVVGTGARHIFLFIISPPLAAQKTAMEKWLCRFMEFKVCVSPLR